MKRTLLALLAALVTWFVVATVLDLALRQVIAGYGAAEHTFTFTPAMMAARLILAALAWLAVGVPLAWGVMQTLAKAMIIFK